MKWKLKDPGMFPVAWHEVVRKGVGEHVVSRHSTRATADAARRTWALFKFCLRGYPSHPTAAFLNNMQSTARIAFSQEAKRWELRVVVKPSVAALFNFNSKSDGEND